MDKTLNTICTDRPAADLITFIASAIIILQTMKSLTDASRTDPENEIAAVTASCAADRSAN